MTKKQMNSRHLILNKITGRQVNIAAFYFLSFT